MSLSCCRVVSPAQRLGTVNVTDHEQLFNQVHMPWSLLYVSHTHYVLRDVATRQTRIVKDNQEGDAIVSLSLSLCLSFRTTSSVIGDATRTTLHSSTFREQPCHFSRIGSCRSLAWRFKGMSKSYSRPHELQRVRLISI
jgi:hypothetical protein